MADKLDPFGVARLILQRVRHRHLKVREKVLSGFVGIECAGRVDREITMSQYLEKQNDESNPMDGNRLVVLERLEGRLENIKNFGAWRTIGNKRVHDFGALACRFKRLHILSQMLMRSNQLSAHQSRMHMIFLNRDMVIRFNERFVERSQLGLSLRRAL